MQPVTIFDQPYNNITGNNTLCIQPSNLEGDNYTLKFFPTCNDDDKERLDLKDAFYNFTQTFDFFDIKPFSETPLDQYKEIFKVLKIHLNNHISIVHFSNFGYCNEDFKKGYQSFDQARNIFLKLVDIIKNSTNKHHVEIHIKSQHYQNWEENEKHNECVKEIINELDKSNNILSLIVHTCEYTWKETNTGNFDTITTCDENEVKVFEKLY